MAPRIASAARGIGGAVSELFAAGASEARADMFRTEAKLDLLRGKGAELEGKSYGRARELALLNRDFTEYSTAIQLAQSGRAITMSLGAARATAAGSGLAEAGSIEDVLRASAQQGELERQVLSFQGLITEEGYQEQADVLANQEEASKVAVEAAQVAHEGHLRAADAEEDAATGHRIAAGISAVSAVASLFGFG